MGITWGPPRSYRPQMGPMVAPWILLSGMPIPKHNLRCLGKTTTLWIIRYTAAYQWLFTGLSCALKCVLGAVSILYHIKECSSQAGWMSPLLHTNEHDDVIKWKHFPRYWPFVRAIHRWPVNFPHKGQWRWALMFSLICSWIKGWVNNVEAGDLRRHRAHYDVTVMNYHIWYVLVAVSCECFRYQVKNNLGNTCILFCLSTMCILFL